MAYVVELARDLFYWLTSLQAAQVSAFADLVVAGGALLAVREYSRQGKLLRQQRMREFHQGFNDTPGARNALLMIEHPEGEIPLFDDPANKWFNVTWADVETALAPGADRSDTRNSAIQNSFLDLLSRWAGLEIMRQQKLVNDEDVRTALRRWFNIILRDKDKPHIRNLRLFIGDRDLRDGTAMFKFMGVDVVAMRKQDWISFKEGQEDGKTPKEF